MYKFVDVYINFIKLYVDLSMYDNLQIYYCTCT